MKPPTLKLDIRDRGEMCPRRGVPLVDLYLNGEGGKAGAAQGIWMHALGVSVPFAEIVAEWFAGHGVVVQKREASTEAEHSRSLFK